MAKSEATTAVCVNRSSFLASFLSRKLVGSKFLISHAKRVLNLDASNRVILSQPLTPLRKLFQYSVTEFPRGVKHPIPVTTILLNCIPPAQFGKIKPPSLLVLQWRRRIQRHSGNLFFGK